MIQILLGRRYLIEAFSQSSDLERIDFFKKAPIQESTKLIADKLGITRRRWVVERTFAWLKRKCRRLLMRWERLPRVWNAFALLGLIYMWLENLLG